LEVLSREGKGEKNKNDLQCDEEKIGVLSGRQGGLESVVKKIGIERKLDCEWEEKWAVGLDQLGRSDRKEDSDWC